jgi:hypothetical protein
MSTFEFCVRSIFLQAMLFVAAGLILGVVWKSWEAVVAGQLILLSCEMGGYALENWLHRRRNPEGMQRW